MNWVKFLCVPMIATVSLSLYSMSHAAVESIQQHLVFEIESSPASWRRKKCQKKQTNVSKI